MKRQAIREGGAQSQRSLPQERGAMKALGKVLIEGLERRGAALDEDRRAAVLRAAEELLDSNIAMRALQVGETMPDFALLAATGERVRLSDVLRAGPAVVSFFRGMWCEYCQAFARALADVYDRVRPAPRFWPSRRNARESRKRRRCHSRGFGTTTTSLPGRSAWHSSCRGT